jgi:hypothetical protein
MRVNRVIEGQRLQRVYTLCFLGPGEGDSRVQFIEAMDDAGAIAEARSKGLFTVKELWDRHRLVATIDPRV